MNSEIGFHFMLNNYRNIGEECDNYIIHSINPEMYLRRVLNSTFPSFDEKQCYESNLQSKPWERRLYLNDYVYSFRIIL